MSGKTPCSPGLALAIAAAALGMTAVASPSQELPPSIEAVATGPTTVEISWDAAPAAHGYDVERATVEDGDWRRINPAVLRGTRFTDAQAPPETALLYRVVALYQPHFSNVASGAVAVTTPSAAPRLAAPAGPVLKRPFLRPAPIEAASLDAGPIFRPKTVSTSALKITGMRVVPPSSIDGSTTLTDPYTTTYYYHGEEATQTPKFTLQVRVDVKNLMPNMHPIILCNVRSNLTKAGAIYDPAGRVGEGSNYDIRPDASGNFTGTASVPVTVLSGKDPNAATYYWCFLRLRNQVTNATYIPRSAQPIEGQPKPGEPLVLEVTGTIP